MLIIQQKKIQAHSNFINWTNLIKLAKLAMLGWVSSG
jgi:hypothetical protein